MLDVAHAIDGEKTCSNVVKCASGWPCLMKHRLPVCDGPCGVRSVMDSAQQRMEEELARHTILDLARKMYRKAPDTFQIEVQEWISVRRSSAMSRARRSHYPAKGVTSVSRSPYGHGSGPVPSL